MIRPYTRASTYKASTLLTHEMSCVFFYRSQTAKHTQTTDPTCSLAVNRIHTSKNLEPTIPTHSTTTRTRLATADPSLTSTVTPRSRLLLLLVHSLTTPCHRASLHLELLGTLVQHSHYIWNCETQNRSLKPHRPHLIIMNDNHGRECPYLVN